MSRVKITPENLPKTMGPYTQVTIGQGTKMVFISGQVPVDASGKTIEPGNIEAQTKQVLENLEIAIQSAGGVKSDICKLTIFVVGLDEKSYQKVAQVRREFFGGDYPASTLVEISRLASPDWLIEIEAYAMI